MGTGKGYGPLAPDPPGRADHRRQPRPVPEMAFAAARCGADVVVASRNLDSLRGDGHGDRSRTGRTALPYAVHFGRWDQLDGLVDAAHDRFGKLDALVNNAGMSPVYDKQTDVTDKCSVVNLNLLEVEVDDGVEHLLGDVGLVVVHR